MAVVVVGFGIGKLVVVAMEPYPVDWTVLTAQGSTSGKEAL
jgi:hypothetical protein